MPGTTEIENAEEKVNNMSKTDILNFLDNLKNELVEYTDEVLHHQVDFEAACVEGEYEKVKKLLNEVPFLSKYKSYIEDQIEYVEEEIDTNGKTEELEKVLEILRSYCD